jgi:hypothetical protein
MNVDQKRNRSFGYGMNRSHRPIGRTAGKYEPGIAKWIMHKHTWFGSPDDGSTGILGYLMGRAEDGKSYGNVVFGIELEAIEGNIDAYVVLHDVTVIGTAHKVEENPDPSLVEVDISPMWIEENGGTLFDATEETI